MSVLGCWEMYVTFDQIISLSTNDIDWPEEYSAWWDTLTDDQMSQKI